MQTERLSIHSGAIVAPPGVRPVSWHAGMGGAALLTALLLAAAPLRATVPAVAAVPDLPHVPVMAFLQGAGDEDRVLTGDHTVEKGQKVADIVVVGGDLRVLGEISGDAVVVGGNLILENGGSVLGDAVVTGGEILNLGGRILGEMRMLDGRGREVAAEVEAAIAESHAAAEAGREAARAARETIRMEHPRVRPERSWFAPIARGFAGLISTVAFGLVLAGIGALLIFYGRTYLETVSDTLRSSLPRSLGVGLAAGFLVVPAFVVLVVALAVTIIGIPLLLLAVPLYPLAITAAIAFGLLAAAHAIGERTAEQRSDRFDLRYRNSYAYLFTGLGMLLMPLLAASLLKMTGFLGFLGTLLQVVTWAVIWAAATAGLGAVILSRGGTRGTFITMSRPADYDSDPLFDEHVSTPREPHV